MNGSELNKIKAQIVSICQKHLGSNLFAIIFAGSAPTGLFIDDWSDIDLLIGVHEVDLNAKQNVVKIIDNLESATNMHVGTNLVSELDITNPQHPIHKLDGKTLQTLLELNKLPQRLIFIDGNSNNLYLPPQATVKEYSLANIGMFLKRNRRTLIDIDLDSLSTTEIQKMLKKEIRASFIISKLALQYVGQPTSIGYRKVLKQATLIFPDFSFSTLKESLELVSNWSNLTSRTQTIDMLQKVDSYIERFSEYIFLKV